MKTIDSLESISDGKLYDYNDCVKADASGCDGCSHCCHSVGDYVALTPYDVNQLCAFLKVDFSTLLDRHLIVQTDNKITLPYLKTKAPKDRCTFLNEQDRCSVHAARPDICRLFPLGRAYDTEGFKYFLQVDACIKPTLDIISVREHLQIPNYSDYSLFINAWYKIIKALQFRVKFIRDPEELIAFNNTFLQLLYQNHSSLTDNFYMQFFKNLPKVKNELGIL